MYKNILVLDDGTEISAGKVGRNAIRSLTCTEAVSSTTDLCPGAACACKLEITLWVEPGSNLLITSGTRLAHYREDESGTRTLCGTYWAVKPTRQTRNTYKIYAYDAVSRLDGIQSAWLRSIQNQFPMTLWAFAQLVAQRCGVEITNDVLPRSGDYQVQAFYADDLTGRQLLAWVAQAACTFLRSMPDGRLEFAWYAERGTPGIGPETEKKQIGYYSGSLSYEDYQTAPIDKVQIRQSDNDVGVLYPTGETGTNALIIQGNLLLTTQTSDALRPVAQAIYDTMHGVSYTPMRVDIPYTADAPAPGQIIMLEDAYGRRMQTYVMSRTISGQRVRLESTGNARRDSTAAVNEQKYTNLQGRMLEISAGVEGLKVTASELSGNYSALSQTVEGFKTEVQETVSSQNERISTAESNYSSLRQTVSGLSSTVSSVKTTANNAASKADSAAAKADGALSDAKSYTDSQLETVRAELSSEIEQTPSRIQLSVLRTGYFSVFEDVNWVNYTAGTFGNKITASTSGFVFPHLRTTDAETLSYARGNTLQGYLSYQIHTAIVGKASNSYFRFSFVAGYTDGTYLIQSLASGDGQGTYAAVCSKTNAALNLAVADKEVEYIQVEIQLKKCSGVIEVGEVWANVAELNGKASTLTLTADGTKISSANIVMRGAVSFEDLSGTGRTTINGANVSTGIIRNAAGTTEYNLDNGTIRMGGSSGNRVYIDSDKIEWYGGNASGGGTGAGTIRNGLTTGTSGDTCVIGADTRYQKIGWYHGGNFQGITVEQVDNEVMVSGKLSVNQAVSCRTLKAWDAKERVVRTPLGNLQMNAMESPEPLFWDVGSGVCDSTGVCWIALRPEYAETISRRTALRWVVTPTGGPGSLWVEKLDTGAMVHGGAGQRFDWACAGVQRGFEGCYAEGDPGRYPVPENPGDWLLTAAMDEAAVDLPLTI